MQHSASIPRRRRLTLRVSASTSWTAVYCSLVFVVWVFAPFVRRVVDWKSSFSAISPIAALPLLILVPAGYLALTGAKRKITRSFELIVVLWTLGMTYGFIVGCLDERPLGALYALVQFMLPLGFGYWVATRAEDSATLYRRISTTVIILAVIAAIYGILQYTLLPPWDKEWLISTKSMGSNGYPFPFRFRTFSTLNAPATFAIFMAVSTILFLPRITFKNAVLLIPIFVGLAITFIRESWVVVVFGIFLFAGLSTRRGTVLKGTFAFIGVGLLLLFASSAFTSDSRDVSTRFTNRLLTLGDVANDASAADRQRQMVESMTAALADPEGSGLGAVGLATRLTSSDQGATNLDSGYVARFLEMGVPGFAAFLGASFIALLAVMRAWRQAIVDRNVDGQNMAALAITMQSVMLTMNLFGDADYGLAAIAMWVSLALVLRAPRPGGVTP